MGERHRLRSFAWFIIALAWFVTVRRIAADVSNALGNGAGADLASSAVTLILLVLGYSIMGYIGQRQSSPAMATGLVSRSGWGREFALGAVLGWAGVAVCALVIAVSGGLIFYFFYGWRPFALIPLDLLILAIAALAQEVAFRGYAFQRLIEASNPFVATVVLSALFAILFVGRPGSSAVSGLVAMFLGWLFSIAYLRTRALWVSWGIHFAWNASMAVLFGLPMGGLTRFSPVISSTALGPTWLTGFDYSTGFNYGPEGSIVGMIVVLVLCLATVRATRELKRRYAEPVFVSAAPSSIPHRAPVVDMGSVVQSQPEPVAAHDRDGAVTATDPSAPQQDGVKDTPVSGQALVTEAPDPQRAVQTDEPQQTPRVGIPSEPPQQ